MNNLSTPERVIFFLIYIYKHKMFSDFFEPKKEVLKNTDYLLTHGKARKFNGKNWYELSPKEQSDEFTKERETLINDFKPTALKHQKNAKMRATILIVFIIIILITLFGVLIFYNNESFSFTSRIIIGSISLLIGGIIIYQDAKIFKYPLNHWIPLTEISLP